MLSIVKSMALRGLDGYLVDVQVDVSSGLPSLEVVQDCLIPVLKRQKKELKQQ